MHEKKGWWNLAQLWTGQETWIIFHNIIGVRFISYLMCSNCLRMSKLSLNLWCSSIFCYSDWTNKIKNKLQVCNLQTGQFISYKFVNQFWLNLPHPSKVWVCRVLCPQQLTFQKVDEDFSKQMWTSRIIQTLTKSK